MKKVLFTLSCLLIFSGSVFAQDTIKAVNAAVFTPLIGVDTVSSVDTTSSFASIPFSGSAAAQRWDITGLKYTGIHYKTRFLAIAPYKYADSVAHNVDSFRYTAKRQTLFTITGLIARGEEVDTQYVAQQNPIPGYTERDSVLYATSFAQYSSNDMILPFPATYRTTWNNNFTYTTKFYLIDSTLNYVRKPATTVTRFSTVSESNAIIGFGTMINGKDTASVLQVQTTRTVTDTFAINGNAFTPMLDSLYGFTNTGSTVTTTTYSERFLRYGYLTPFASFEFADNSFSKVKKGEVLTEQNLLHKPTSIPYVINASDIHVYPNPVTNHTVNIIVPKANGKWSYALINMVGQVVSAQSFSVSGNNANTSISLPASIAPGTYYLRLFNDNQQAAIQPLSILN